MRVGTLHAIRQQYGFCCGYCDISETDAGTILTVDHYHPRSRDGSDDFGNLVYCCHACNEHKGSHWNSSGIERILHPLQDDLSAHYVEQSDCTLFALTDTGRFHVARLQLNRPALIANRLRRQAVQNEQRERTESLAILNEILRLVTEVDGAITRIRTGGE